MKVTTARVPEFDGIRGVAILMVLACHFQVLLFGTTPPAIWKPFYHLMTAGWLGVDVFFVLSGFLITNNILKSREEPYFWTDFYSRRAFRILPAYIAVVAIGLAIFPPNLANKPSVLLTLFFAANWTITGLLHGGEIPYFTHLWSLAIEEQFYFGWPQLAARVKPLHVFQTALGIAILSGLTRICFASQGMNGWIIYKITPSRLDGIALGAALAAGMHCPRLVSVLQKTWVILLAGGASGLLFAFLKCSLNLNPWSAEAQMFGIPSIAVIIAMAIFAAHANRLPTNVKFLLKAASLRYLGTRSYSLYLINTPIAFELERLLANWQSRGMADNWLTHVVLVFTGLAFSVVLSELLFRFVELPAQEFGRTRRLSTASAPVASRH